MKQLTDAERLEVAMSLLSEHEDIDEYARLCAELEHQPKRNGFRNVPAECENKECNECTTNDISKRAIACPYIKESMGNILMIPDAVRALANSLSEDETVLLPDLPPVQWIDETMNDNEKHIKFIDCNLVEILNFIADMAE